MEKTEIRKINMHNRKVMSKAEVQPKSSVIAKLFLESELYRNAKTIMLYMPLGNEVDTGSIMEKAFADGKRAVLPMTDSKDKIIPYYIDADTKLKIGAYSVREPIDTQMADPNDIDIVIVPGVAFDRYGNRVGFGKGCYDGFLKDTNALKVGVCYEFQMCDTIAADQYDVKMDYVISEKGWL